MTHGTSRADTLEKGFLLALLFAVTLAMGWLIEPFFSAIVWSVIVAVLFRPLYKHMVGVMPQRKNSAAAITLLAVILLLIVPTFLLIAALVEQISSLYERIVSGQLDFTQTFLAMETRLPASWRQQFQSFGLDDMDSVRARIDSALANSLNFIATQVLAVGQGAFRFLLALGVMLYLTFFLIRDGGTIATKIKDSLPLPIGQRDILIERFVTVIRATIKGSLVVAIIQGTIGGILFWALGIPGALLWGVSMALLSLLPAIGTGFIWAPMAIYLLFTGSVWQGIVLLVCGIFIVSMVDNLLRPILVGRDARLPDYVVLISTLGGLELFGINGIVIGPLLAALFMAVWTIFTDARLAERSEESSL